MPSQADIDIRTTALRDFAGNSAIDLDADGIRGEASAAANGNSQMEEGAAFFKIQQTALEQMTKHLETVKKGDYGYREGASRMADTYDTTEGNVTSTLRSVVPFASTTTRVV